MSNLERELKGVVKEIEGSVKNRKKGSGKGGSSLEKRAKRLLE